MKRLVTLFIVLFAIAQGAALAQQEFLVGLIPEQNVFRQMERYKPLGEYLSKRAGIRVSFTMLSRYGNIIESFREGKMDGAFWGSFTGALAIKRAGVIPLARPVWLDGSSSYHSMIFSRKDSGIETFGDARGKKVAFVDKATTAGYIFPLSILRSEFELTQVGDYFSEVIFTGSHDAAIRAVLEGEADIGAAKNTIYSAVAKEDPRIEEELKVLRQSKNVPSNAFGVRKNIDPSLAAKIKTALLSMDKDKEGMKVLSDFGAKRFIETSEEDYQPVFEFAKGAGIELTTYKYRNE